MKKPRAIHGTQKTNTKDTRYLEKSRETMIILDGYRTRV